MTESPDTKQEAEASPAPASAETSEEKTPKETAKKDSGLPVGQIAVGGLGATVLGSAALASAVGPLGWLAAPAVATAGGVGYVAYKTRKRRGRRSSSGRSQPTKTTTTRTTGGGSRLGSSGMSGGRGRTASTASRSAGVAAAPRRAGGSAAGSARPSGGSSSRPGGRAGGSKPRAGSSPRGAAPRGSSRGTTPRGGGLFGRSGDASSKKRSGRPSSGGGTSTTPRGGSMSKSRWGGSSGPTTAPGGRMKRAARAARDWADDKTGRKASSAFKAARKEKGFRARSKAASRAVRKEGGGKAFSGIVGVIVAAFTGLASLFGKPDRAKKSGRTAAEDADPTSANPYYPVYTWLADGTPFTYLIPKEFVESVDPLRLNFDKATGPTRATTAHTGGTTMAGLPAANIAHDMAGAMARYEPADAWQVLRDARQWPDVFAQTGFAVKNYADRLEMARFPLNPVIVGKIREMFDALNAVYEHAEELEPLMRKAHADDIARQEARRGDERKWNV